MGFDRFKGGKIMKPSMKYANWDCILTRKGLVFNSSLSLENMKAIEDQVFAERFILKGGLIDLTITLK